MFIFRGSDAILFPISLESVETAFGFVDTKASIVVYIAKKREK